VLASCRRARASANSCYLRERERERGGERWKEREMEGERGRGREGGRERDGRRERETYALELKSWIPDVSLIELFLLCRIAECLFNYKLYK